ncbi:MAG: PilZ domain-containing protein [Planctomycetaceae bacterium]|nr:PilZ domain-containing protein [Planctomycetales bacterium]MCB9924603.1 PilZ domain-containing protein [Planctomycetaceae bacterium]
MTGIEPLPAPRSSADTHDWGEQLSDELTHFEYETRAHPRTKLTVEILIRASNRDGSKLGTPFNAITTDISPGGIGFLHTTPVGDKYLVIELGVKHRRASVLVEVVRCRPVGNFYEIGSKFIRLFDGLES